MKTGDVVKTKTLRILLGDPKPENYQETWNTRKGYRYVVLLLGIEQDGTPFDPIKAMHDLGWMRKPIRKPRERRRGESREEFERDRFGTAGPIKEQK